MTPIEFYSEEAWEADEQGCWPSGGMKKVRPGVMRVLYVNGVATMYEYICPCGCGSYCPTFFPTEKRKRTPERPLWDFSRGLSGPTLSPSVRRTSGCKAHYNITDGKVVWHGDSGK